MLRKESKADTWILSWIEAWGNSVVQYAFSIVLSESIAQDIAQEAFRRLDKAHRQDPTHVFDPAWLFSLVRSLTLARKTSSRTVIVDDDQENLDHHTYRAIWQKMDPLDRETAWLFYYLKWPIKRIALHSNQTVSEVQSRLLRTQQRLGGMN